MKNIRLLVRGLCLLLATGLGSNALFAADDGRTDAPAGGTVKLQIERKEITKDQAETYRTSGTKIGLGVYVIFSKEWGNLIENLQDVRFSQSNISWAFYETEAYSSIVNSTDPSHYLKDPADYMQICARNGLAGQPADACFLTTSGNWYGSYDWQQFGWPTFAWGTGFSGGILYTDQAYMQILDDGSYKIKIFEIQFKLNSTNTNFRSLPVGFLDDILGHEVIDKSNSNCQINIVNDLTKAYWPAGQVGADWTDLKQTAYFELIPGGLFIQTGPEVETFEPSF